MTVLALLRALAVPLFAEVVSFDVGMTVDCCHFGNDIATQGSTVDQDSITDIRVKTLLLASPPPC